ncbi:MAG: type II secretion system protein N [Thiobacillus sp.]
MLVYLALLLAWAPASLLAWALPQLTQEAVWLERPEGSVWRGRAAGLAIRLGTGPAVQLGRVNWQLRPQDFLTGHLGYQVNVAGADVHAAGMLSAGRKGMELRATRAELPASWLGQVSPDLDLWQPGGKLVFETDSLFFGRDGGTAGQATLRWFGAVSGRVRQPLGNYRANLEGTGRGFGIKLSTEAGALQLQGSGRWNPGGGMTLFGQARPAPGSQTELEGLLSLFGPAQANGDRAIRIGR